MDASPVTALIAWLLIAFPAALISAVMYRITPPRGPELRFRGSRKTP